MRGETMKDKSKKSTYSTIFGVDPIMSFKTDDSNIVADDIILKTQSGVEGTLDFIADASSGMTTVKLELAMVPEPAAFAGLLGAAALLLAIRRRRK